MKVHRLLWIFIYMSLSVGFLNASSYLYYSNVWTEGDEVSSLLGTRPFLAKYGLYYAADMTFDFNWPAYGGIQTSKLPVYQYLLNVQFGVEMEKLISWKGMRVLLDFQYHQTKHPTKYVGDWQGFDNINAENLTQIGELWCEQVLFKKKLFLKFGKIDAITTFNYTDFAQILINNSFSQNPTIIGFPTYPNQAVGVIVELLPLRWLSFRTALFDGSSALGIETGEKGARRFFNHLGEHAELLNELQFEWGSMDETYYGNVALGVWGLTATLPNFKGGAIKGTSGVYVFADQTLWKESLFSKKKKRAALRELQTFVQWGICNKEVSDIKDYWGVGFNLIHLSKKLEDTLSIGLATVLFSNASGAFYPKHFEMSFEATYQFRLLKMLLVQPDFQYIVHPSGIDRRNAIVGTLRLMVNI